MDFKAKIKNFRLQCLMNQTEFGEILGVSFTTVNRWENGKAYPNIKTMKRLKLYSEENNLSAEYGELEKCWRASLIKDHFTQD